MIGSDVHGKARRVGKYALGALAALLLGACSSRNPDSLIGMNLDENAAMMDANEALQSNVASTESTGANVESSNAASAPVKPTAVSSKAREGSNVLENSGASTLNDTAPQDESPANEIENNEDQPPRDG